MKFFNKKDIKSTKNEDIENNNINLEETDDYTYEYNSTPDDYNYNQNYENSSYNYDYSQSNQSYDYYNHSNSDYTGSDYCNTDNQITIVEEDKETKIQTTENIISPEINTKLSKDIIPSKKNINKEKPTGLLVLFVVIAGIFVNYGIFNIGENFQKSTALNILPHTINDFSLEKIKLGSLSDGRNVYLRELPIKPEYSVALPNSIEILNIYKDEVLFFEDEITDSSYSVGPVQTYNLKSGEFKTVLSTPKPYFLSKNFINDKYIVLDLQDSLYIYDRTSNIGEYIFKNTLGDNIMLSFDYNTILLDESIYYIYKNTTHSYHIPTKNITSIIASNENAEKFSYKFRSATDEYVIIERLNNETDVSETLLIDTKNDNEVILLDYNLTNFSIIDKDDSLLLLDGNSDKGYVDAKFNKETKELTILDNSIYNNIPYLHSNANYKDLIFETAKDYVDDTTMQSFLLNIYSTETQKETNFNLSTYIGTPQNYCYTTKYDSGILLEFEVVKNKYFRRYYISVEKS
ncbi:MAG: hypothetical protein ACRDCW_00640 [Sarcina sp.]